MEGTPKDTLASEVIRGWTALLTETGEALWVAGIVLLTIDPVLSEDEAETIIDGNRSGRPLRKRSKICLESVIA